MKEGWKTVMKQQKLVEKMTIEEKAAILSGKTVWQTREIDRFSISCCAAETKDFAALIACTNFITEKMKTIL